MNKERRARIAKVIDALAELQSEIEAIRADEEEAFGAMPESLQNSDRGQAMQEAVDALEEVSFDDIIASLMTAEGTNQ